MIGCLGTTKNAEYVILIKVIQVPFHCVRKRDFEVLESNRDGKRIFTFKANFYETNFSRSLRTGVNVCGWDECLRILCIFILCECLRMR